MNILFIHANGIVPTAGGISRTTANLGRLLRKHHFGVWFVGVANIDPSAEYDEQQLFLPTTKTNEEKNISFLCNLISEKKIQIIINQAPLNLSLVNLLNNCAKITHIKVVACYHNSILTPIIRFAYCQEYRLKQHHLRWLFHLLKCKSISNALVQVYIYKWRSTYRQTVAKSDAVVLLCDGQVNELLRMCGYKDCSKAFVIPNCIPSSGGGTQKKSNNVVWTGTFDFTIKRPDLMLRVWQKVSPIHPNWTLYMIGDGPSLLEMKKLSQSLHLRNIVFTGRIIPDQYYESAKIQCVTSIHESFSLVSVEAMEKGNPVIAFNSFTAASMIIASNETGYLIKPFDVDSFANHLSRLMDDEVLRQLMGERAKESINRFSEESVYTKWQGLFEMS